MRSKHEDIVIEIAEKIQAGEYDRALARRILEAQIVNGAEFGEFGTIDADVEECFEAVMELVAE